MVSVILLQNRYVTFGTELTKIHTQFRYTEHRASFTDSYITRITEIQAS